MAADMKDWVSLGTFQEGPGGKLMATLKKAGIGSKKQFNPNNCTTGCATTYEVLADASQKDLLIEVLRRDFQQKLPGELQVAYDVNAVFDASQPTAKCPACTTEFSTNLTECPECGLVIG